MGLFARNDIKTQIIAFTIEMMKIIAINLSEEYISIEDTVLKVM